MTKGRRGKRSEGGYNSKRWLLALIVVAFLVYITAWQAPTRSFSSTPITTHTENTASEDRPPESKGITVQAEEEKPVQSSHAAIKSEHHEKLVKERAKAAILGAFVADAATMGMHWIYDSDKIQRLLKEHGRIGTPEFFEPPSCPFYQYESGNLSPYGDEALPLLESMVEEGGIDPQQLSKHMYDHFKSYEGRLNEVSRGLIENIDGGKQYPNAGPPNNQAHGLVKVPVVVGRYAGLSNVKEKMLEAVKVHQNHPDAEASGVAGALILERVLLGDTITASIEWALEKDHIPAMTKQWLNSALHENYKNVAAAVQQFGPSCHLPGSFISPFYVAMHSVDYTEAVRENIIAGGDNCSRSHLIGALFAAQDGLASIPLEWRKKTLMYTDLEHLVDDLLERRGAKQ